MCKIMMLETNFEMKLAKELMNVVYASYRYVFEEEKSERNYSVDIYCYIYVLDTVRSKFLK